MANENANTSLNNSSRNLAMRTIENKIEYFISSGIFNDLEEFMAANPNLAAFQTNTKLNNTLRKVWGYQITEQEYQDILETLKQKDTERKKIDMDNIETVHANGKDIVTYHGKDGDVVLDDSYNGKSLEEQMTDLQAKDKSLQNGGEKNTEMIVKDMQNRIKPTVQQLDTEKENHQLSNKEEEYLRIAKEFEKQIGTPVKVSVEDGLLFTEDGSVYAIEERDGVMGVYTAQENAKQKEKAEELPEGNKTQEMGKQKVMQKTLKTQAGFSNTFTLVFIAGVVMGLIAMSAFLP